MRFSLIDEEKTHHSVSRTSGVLGSSRAGYYASRNRDPQRRKSEDEELKDLIAEIHKSSFSTYGAPRIHQELAQAHGIHVGKKRVARLMRELQIEGVSRRKKRKAEKGKAEMPAFPDLVKLDFTATRADGLWVADITYIPTW